MLDEISREEDISNGLESANQGESYNEQWSRNSDAYCVPGATYSTFQSYELCNCFSLSELSVLYFDRTEAL